MFRFCANFLSKLIEPNKTASLGKQIIDKAPQVKVQTLPDCEKKMLEYRVQAEQNKVAHMMSSAKMDNIQAFIKKNR